MLPEMHKVRLVFLDQFGRHKFFTEPPDKVHFQMNRAEGEARFANQQDAAVEKEASADESHHDGDKVVTRAGGGDDADGDTGRHEDAERPVEGDHAALEDACAAGQLVQLGIDDGASFVKEFQNLSCVRQFFEAV